MALSGDLSPHTLLGDHGGKVHLVLIKGDVFYVGFSVTFWPTVPFSNWNNKKMNQ